MSISSDRVGARGVGLFLTCATAAVAVGALAGRDVLLHPARAIVGYNPSSDFQIITWSLEWWPWAVGHWTNPLHTSLLWAPHGFSTLWMTTIPVPALLGLPLTLTAGPLVAYNVLMLTAVVLAAAAAYLLCYELTGRAVASLVGGLLFGLSPYMLGHTFSQHLDLTMVFPLPLMVMLGLRYSRRQTSARGFVLGFAALLVILLGSSFELFVDLALVVMAAGLVAVAVAGSRRALLLRVGVLVAAGYAVCLPVLVPLAILGLSAPHGAVRAAPANYSADLLNLIVPTPTLLAGRGGWEQAITQHFVGNIGERDSYVGVPLLLALVLGLRAGRRRGAWLAGILIGVAFLLSLGPTLDIGGHVVAHLPFSTAGAPIFDNVQPARFSVFVALGASVLCALWLARPRAPAVHVAVGVLLVASLLPDFWAAHTLSRSWASSRAFAWSTPHAPAGFVDDPRWQRLLAGGSNVLVLPTGDRSAADYWQVRSGMRFALAVPATPFAPPAVAASPTVARLVDNVLPQLDGRALAAARLRAFLLANGVSAVVVTRSGSPQWKAVAERATATGPVHVRGSWLFRVSPALRPLRAEGEVATARVLGTDPAMLRMWLQFGGRRAQLRVSLPGMGAVTLSSRDGDAEAPAASVDQRGVAAVAFTEWRGGAIQLRVATHSTSGWRLATLDHGTEPIWSERTAIAADGTVLAAWIAETGSERALRFAVLPLGGNWGRPVTLDSGQGLGSVALAARGDVGLAAWRDSDASEARVQASLFARGGWRRPVLLARSLDLLDTVSVSPRPLAVRWRLWDGHRATYFRAAPPGLAWTRPRRGLHSAAERSGRTGCTARSRCESYIRRAERAVALARTHWWDARRGWYDERLDPTWQPNRPLARLWSAYPLFESLSAIAIGDPSRAHRAAVRSFALKAERYWNPAIAPHGAYAYYVGTRMPTTDTYFDDNGWWAIAFVDAYQATRDRRFLLDAEKAFRFIVTSGWDNAGGGTWWDTRHHHTTTEPLAAAAYVGVRLYEATGDVAFLRRSESLIAWADAHAWNAQAHLYARSQTDPTIMDYVEGMMIGARVELCTLPGRRADCAKAEQLARASVRSFTLNWEPSADAIYLRFLLDLYRHDGNRRWYDLVERDVRRITRNALATTDGLYTNRWDGSPLAAGELLRFHAATTSLLAWLGATAPPS